MGMNVPSGQNTCWITFLGAHGHCEAHSTKFELYNSDDTPEGYSGGSGQSAEKCLARADWWMKYCDTPVLATFVPGGVSSTWNNDWIMHDSHGGRMFEQLEDALNHINPDSLSPQKANPSKYNSEFKSQPDKTPDYHDSPEYRKSLHLEGAEKEEVLKKLRERLGLSGKSGKMGGDVKVHQGVDTAPDKKAAGAGGVASQPGNYAYAGEQPKYEAPKEEPKYEEPKYEEPKYDAPKEEPKYEEPKYEEPKEEPKYEEPKYEEPKYEEPTTEAKKYEEPTTKAQYDSTTKYEETTKYEAPKEEEKYEAPAEDEKYEGGEGGDDADYADDGDADYQEEPDSFKDTIIEF